MQDQYQLEESRNKDRTKLLDLFFRANRTGEHYFARMARCKNLFHQNFESPEAAKGVQEFWAARYIMMRELAAYSTRLKGGIRAKLRILGVVPKEKEVDGRQNPVSL